MDRAEILKLALASQPDAKQALDLAKQMDAFIKGDPLPAIPVQAIESDLERAIRKELKMENHAGKPWRGKRRWTDEEKLLAATMIDEGKTWGHIATELNRTLEGVEKAWRDGLFPCARVWTSSKRPYTRRRRID